MRTVERYEDMSPTGKLRLIQQPDGDIIVVIQPDHDQAVKNRLPPLGISVEFTTCGGGGGQSQHTRDALMALFDAIERDNKGHPQFRDGSTCYR